MVLLTLLIFGIIYLQMKDNEHKEILKIYGFGSFFKGAETFNDIDFLIIHQSISKASCKAAIDCKRMILKEIKDSHISILSTKEECSIQFIEKSNALFLCELFASSMERDLSNLLDKVINNIRAL